VHEVLAKNLLVRMCTLVSPRGCSRGMRCSRLLVEGGGGLSRDQGIRPCLRDLLLLSVGVAWLLQVF
jgi:hypothetical protein